MPPPFRRSWGLAPLASALAIGGAALAAPVAGQAANDPVWGAYASGLGYPVNSDALLERAALEGIDPRCLMTVTVAWMEHPRIIENVALGLLNPLVEGVTRTEAQGAMYAHSPFFNPDIDCTGGRDERGRSTGGGPPGPPAPPGPPPGPGPGRCLAERPAGSPDLETGPGFVTQWYWNGSLGIYCGYLRQGGGLHQYTLKPDGNGYYLWGLNRATSSYERVMRMDRGPAPDPSTGWVEAGSVLRINPDGSLSNVGWWWGRVP